LEEISWEEFLKKFEESKLAFLYQEKKANGEISTFNKFVNRRSIKIKFFPASGFSRMH
jgi:hypothetical protein